MIALRIMLVAGEASGDVHGADLAREIQKRAPRAKLFGMGGRRMQEAGVRLLYNPTRLSPIGFVEAVRGLSLFKRLLARFGQVLETQRPNALVLIDFPGFNLPLARLAHERGIPVLYYIAPKVWAHGASRVQKLADAVDKMCVIFDFEPPIFQAAGIDCEFVGNPLVDACRLELDQAAARRECQLAEGRTTLALLPGSRTQEIGSLLPVMLEAGKRLAATHPDVQFVLPVAHTLDQTPLRRQVEASGLAVAIVETGVHKALRAADAAIVASGTATLEAALIGTPHVCIYRVSPLGYAVGKMVVKTPFISLPNIVAQREVIVELLQRQASAERIAAETERLLDPVVRARMADDFAEIRRRLGESGAAGRVAERVITLAEAEVAAQ
ncbi:MAG TPA: lipid-A-disaccharide synthase [Limnochordia bacterium]|nr:lipid-A-disaccharide synthase [Limnochordia bacterium]